MSTTTNYIWDEDNLLAEADGSNVVQTVYTNEPEQYGNLVSTRISGTSSYHHFDDLVGSTRQLTNSAAAVTDTFVYDAWGSIVLRTGGSSLAMKWNGEAGYYNDAETGLLVVRERTYVIVLVRWTSIDPDPDAMGLNPYAYAQNDPIGLIDPGGTRQLVRNAGGQTRNRYQPPVEQRGGGRGDRRTPPVWIPGTKVPGTRPGDEVYIPRPGTAVDPSTGEIHWEPKGLLPPPQWCGVGPCSVSAVPGRCASPQPQPLPLPEPELRPQPGFKRPPYPRACRSRIFGVGEIHSKSGCPAGAKYECHHIIPQVLFGPSGLPLWLRDSCHNLCCLPRDTHKETVGGRPNWYNECMRTYVQYTCYGSIEYTGKNNPLCLLDIMDEVRQWLDCCPMKRCTAYPCDKCS
jgi:RHS repeat-associated protein